MVAARKKRKRTYNSLNYWVYSTTHHTSNIPPFFYLYPLLNPFVEGQAWEGNGNGNGNGNVMNVKVSRIIWYRIKKPIGKVVKVLDHDF